MNDEESKLLQELDDKLKWMEFEKEQADRIATMKRNDNIIKKMTFDFMKKEKQR